MIAKLPSHLTAQHADWRDTGFVEQRNKFAKLASDGQAPEAMVISCCDSRVQSTEIFGAGAGDFFIHRNIANLVPPYALDGPHQGTAAAIEYAVCALKVRRIIVLGHSQCGGMQYAHDRALPDADKLPEFDFVGAWLDIVDPEMVEACAAQAEGGVHALTIASVQASVRNLASYPFIAARCAEGDLALHGAVFDIGAGALIDCAEAS